MTDLSDIRDALSNMEYCYRLAVQDHANRLGNEVRKMEVS